MRFMNLLLAAVVILGGAANVSAIEAETLPLLTGGHAPQNFEEMWAGFDPCAEPLEVEVLKEWREDDVLLRIVRFRIGVFKGKKAQLAAVYGFSCRLDPDRNEVCLDSSRFMVAASTPITKRV